jgi:hypothetical protein
MVISNGPRGLTYNIVIILLLLLPEIAAQVNSPSDSKTGDVSNRQSQILDMTLTYCHITSNLKILINGISSHVLNIRHIFNQSYLIYSDFFNDDFVVNLHILNNYLTYVYR